MGSNQQPLDYRPFAFPTEPRRLILRVEFKLLLILYSAIYSYNVSHHRINAQLLHQACIISFLFKQKISPLMKLGEIYVHIH